MSKKRYFGIFDNLLFKAEFLLFLYPSLASLLCSSLRVVDLFTIEKTFAMRLVIPVLISLISRVKYPLKGVSK